MEKTKNYIIGIFNDEDVLLDAVKKVRQNDVKIEEVFTPFPVHGLEDVLGYKRTRLPIAAFMFGALGTTVALVMQFYMMDMDWTMIIGGKNTYSVTFVPVTFELTVLISAFGMVGTFFVVSNLKPWGKPKLFDIRSTDDKHVIAIDLASNKSLNAGQIESILKSSGASEVKEKNFE